MTSPLFRWYRWLVWFWWAKVRRQQWTVCRPDCALCEVQCRVNDHYNACEVCQGDEYPCEAMTVLRAEEDAVSEAMFPDTPTQNGSVSFTATTGTSYSVPAQVFRPWVWK